MLHTTIHTSLGCALAFFIGGAMTPAPPPPLPLIPACQSCTVTGNTFGTKFCIGTFAEGMTCYTGDRCTTLGWMSFAQKTPPPNLIRPIQPAPGDGWHQHFDGLVWLPPAFFNSSLPGIIVVPGSVVAYTSCIGGPPGGITLSALMGTAHEGQLNNPTPCQPAWWWPCQRDGILCGTGVWGQKDWLCK